jgi:hypothetical protein
MEPLFNNIKLYDYIQPIKNLYEYYKNLNIDYYKNILDNYQKINLIKKENENILLYYLMCRPNAKILITFSSYNIQSFLDNLKKNTNFYYHKSLFMNKKEIISLLYQIMYDRFNSYHNLLNYINEIGFLDNNKIQIYFYEGNYEIDRKINFLINNSFNELVEISKIFLNENSLNLLKYQNIQRLYEINHDEKIKKIFNELLFEINKFSLFINNNLILMSGIILYIYGFRIFNDIDIGILPIDINIKIKAYDIKVMKKDDKIKIGNEIINYYDIIINPKYHFYFLGIKCIILDIEMERKRQLKINRPRTYVDIIMVNELLNRNYNLPYIIKNYEKYPYNNKQFFKSMIHHFKNRYNKNLSKEDIENKLIKYSPKTIELLNKNSNKIIINKYNPLNGIIFNNYYLL